jgi:hypothetical protein
MQRGVKGLDDSILGHQLAWLVLRVIAELSPCTKTSLVAYVSGGDSTSEAGHNNISNALLQLKALTFIQFAQEQIAITDEGRRFLDDLTVVAVRPRTPYFAFAIARMPALLAKYTLHLKRFCIDCLIDCDSRPQFS